MTVHYTDADVTLHHGDCLDVIRTLPDNSVDSVVTDPPYGLSATDPSHVAETLTRWLAGDREYLPQLRGFMGSAWDGFVPPVAVWDECLRVLKPGGHLLAFAGSRTHDLMSLGIRLAGFDIRDSIAWLYGSGFPKSLDVSKAIDRAAGAERPREEPQRRAHPSAAIAASGFGADGWAPQTRDAQTEDARRWEGWGTALKPAFEPIVVARKPLAGTVAANVLAHGTGALNIDATRIPGQGGGTVCTNRDEGGVCRGHANAGRSTSGETVHGPDSSPAGRWPTNVVLDGHMAAQLDAQSGTTTSVRADRGGGKGATATYGQWGTLDDNTRGYDDAGGASRFFPVFRYEAKAPTVERPREGEVAHPTVKPLDLMRWLVRLVTPSGGTVLEPFAGSGTTAEAAVLEGMRCIAIEREADYLPLIVQRLSKPLQVGFDFGDLG